MTVLSFPGLSDSGCDRDRRGCAPRAGSCSASPLFVAAAGVLIGFYVGKLTTERGLAVLHGARARRRAATRSSTSTIETVAAVGPQLSPAHPDYVSYLIRDTQGQWLRDTVWQLPANATVHVTIYNFDGASGLRNPYLARPQGVDGNVMHGRRQDARRRSTRTTRRTRSRFRAYGLDRRRFPASPTTRRTRAATRRARCRSTTGRSSSRSTPARRATTGGSASCRAPRAGSYGFGGPMQTIGYMDGFLDVV